MSESTPLVVTGLSLMQLAHTWLAIRAHDVKTADAYRREVLRRLQNPTYCPELVILSLNHGFYDTADGGLGEAADVLEVYQAAADSTFRYQRARRNRRS